MEKNKQNLISDQDKAYYKYIACFLKIQKAITKREILLAYVENLIHEFDYFDSVPGLSDKFKKRGKEWEKKYRLKTRIIKITLHVLKTYASSMTFVNWMFQQETVSAEINARNEFTKNEMEKARADLKDWATPVRMLLNLPTLPYELTENERYFIEKEKQIYYKIAEKNINNNSKEENIKKIINSIGLTSVEDYEKIERAYDVYKNFKKK